MSLANFNIEPHTDFRERSALARMEALRQLHGAQGRPVWNSGSCALKFGCEEAEVMGNYCRVGQLLDDFVEDFLEGYRPTEAV